MTLAIGTFRIAKALPVFGSIGKAACDFCSYARNKAVVTERRWIDRRELARALPILYQRGVRYLNFQGGEPLLHLDF